MSLPTSFPRRPERCILHANCQGEPLARLLAASPAFAARWSIRHYVNYIREPVPDEDLAACSLFLYQDLGPQWGGLSSAALLSRLPAHATALCLPNLFFKGYWPLWTSQSSMHFGDVYLDYLVDQGLNPAEILRLYLSPTLTARYDLDALKDESQALERRREASAILSCVDYIEEHWRDVQLFSTVNHPGPELMRRVADAALAALGLPRLPEHLPAGLELSCDPHFHLPIHPTVGRHFGLPFAGEERRYPAYAHWLTFRQYALCYIDCRQKGLNLLEYLQAVRL